MPRHALVVGRHLQPFAEVGYVEVEALAVCLGDAETMRSMTQAAEPVSSSQAISARLMLW